MNDRRPTNRAQDYPEFICDDGLNRRWRVKAPNLHVAKMLATPEGMRLEADPIDPSHPLYDDLKDFSLYFVVSPSTGEAVDYLGIRKARPGE